MKKRALSSSTRLWPAAIKTLAVILLLHFGPGLASGVEIPITPKTVIQFADDREAAKELARQDTFVESMSPFDRAARKQTSQPVSTEEFLNFVSAQALAWNEEETGKLTRIIGSISNKLAPYTLDLPARILLLKTTGAEEGDAAYCRNKNAIVLPRRKLAGSGRNLEDLFIHELFHILSRNNRKFRDAAYGIAGFKPCPEVEFPIPLKPRKLTNPDAPRNEHYIEVELDGKTMPVVPILFSNQAEYDASSSKNIFSYLTFKLLAIESVDNQWKPRYREGNPWLLDIAEVKNFHEQIGRNTGYIIHPEELLADNFVFLVNQKSDLPSPEIIDKLRQLLSKP